LGFRGLGFRDKGRGWGLGFRVFKKSEKEKVGKEKKIVIGRPN
jgi:hypothetical protein